MNLDRLRILYLLYLHKRSHTSKLCSPQVMYPAVNFAAADNIVSLTCETCVCVCVCVCYSPYDLLLVHLETARRYATERAMSS